MILGPELIKNGDFSSSSDWAIGIPWLIQIGTLRAVLPFAAPGTASQDINISNGVKYIVSWEDTSEISIQYDVALGGVDVGTPSIGVLNTFEVTAGSSGDIVLTSTTDLTVQNNAIDNLSVRVISVASNIEEAIFDLMRSSLTLNGIIESRIYPEVVPQNTALPAVYYTQIAGPRQHTLGSSDDMVPSRWQFTIVGTTYAELRTISDAIRLILDSFSGTVGDVVVQCSHLIDENDLTDIRPGTDKLRRYTKAMDFNIWYNE